MHSRRKNKNNNKKVVRLEVEGYGQQPPPPPPSSPSPSFLPPTYIRTYTRIRTRICRLRVADASMFGVCAKAPLSCGSIRASSAHYTICLSMQGRANLCLESQGNEKRERHLSKYSPTPSLIQLILQVKSCRVVFPPPACHRSRHHLLDPAQLRTSSGLANHVVRCGACSNQRHWPSLKECERVHDNPSKEIETGFFSLGLEVYLISMSHYLSLSVWPNTAYISQKPRTVNGKTPCSLTHPVFP